MKFSQRGHLFCSFLRNKFNPSTALSNSLFRSASLACELLFSRAKKVAKNALYVAHWATEIDLMFKFNYLWDAHLLFVCEAHPNAPDFEHSFFTRKLGT